MGRKNSVKVTFYQDRHGGWRWRVQRGNNLVLAASSEAFSRKDSARRNFRRTRAALMAVADAR